MEGPYATPGNFRRNVPHRRKPPFDSLAQVLAEDKTWETLENYRLCRELEPLYGHIGGSLLVYQVS